MTRGAGAEEEVEAVAEGIGCCAVAMTAVVAMAAMARLAGELHCTTAREQAPGVVC